MVARELGNEPANYLTPRILATRAEAMAREAGLSIEILDEKKIAELKMPDLNANDLEAAMKMVAGTARSMGLEVVD